MAKHEETPKASAKLVSGVFPPLEGPDGPPPPPPPVGTCQSLCGWGYFEWDGNDWLRPVDDMSYTHQEMWECLVGNDQMFDYEEAKGAPMRLFVSTVDKCANCPYMKIAESGYLCTHGDMEECSAVEPDSRPYPCPLSPASSLRPSVDLQEYYHEYKDWGTATPVDDTSEIDDHDRADDLPELLDLLDDDEPDDPAATEEGVELLGLSELLDDDRPIREGAGPRTDISDEPAGRWPRLLAETIAKCSECPCMLDFDTRPICGHCDALNGMMIDDYDTIPDFCPLSSVASFIRSGAH